MASVVVVGAGIAGLTCAWRLLQAGHDVEVLEREPEPGGRMRSERRGEFVLDRGAQFIASGYRNLHALAAELGLDQKVRSLPVATNAILRRGRLHASDYDSPAAFLRSDLISWRAKLGLGRVLFELFRQRKRLDPLHPERAFPLDVEDLASWARRRAGEEALEYVLAPAFSATFDSDPEQLSGAFALLALRFVFAGFRLQAFEGGNGLLTRTLGERLRVRTGWDAVAVETAPDGARVRYRAHGHEGAVLADAAVVAVPGSLVPELVRRPTPAERAFFERVRYVRGAIVHLLLARPPATLPYYGVAFPRPEGLDLYGLAVDHHKPGAVPEGAGLLNAALTASAAERTWDAPGADVVELVLANLARTPIGRLEPVDAVVHRWSPMLPQFGAGYTRALAAFLARSERSPRLAFAGDYLVGPYTEAACTSGLRAADEVERALAKRV
jgi:oxygen-dependent protoporphyrinogen oxidase